MDQRTQHILTAPPLPLLLRFSAPNSFAFLVQSTVSLTEVWFIGQLGKESLAAIALVFPLLMFMQMISTGAFGGAVTSAIARALGAGDTDRAERLIWQALTMAFSGALVLLLIFLAIGEPFLRSLGGTGDILEMAYAYSLMLFVGGAGIWFVGVVGAIFRGMGDMRYPATMMVIGSLIQVPVSGALVLGYFGAPQLGLLGAAVSVVVTSSLMSFVMLSRLIWGKTPIKLRLSQFDLRQRDTVDIGRVALPACLSPVSTVTTILVLTAIVGRFGPEALAGYGIGSRIEFLMSALIFGIGAAMTSIVGMSVGAGKFERAEQIGWVGAGISALLGGVIGIGLAVFPEAWIPLFSDDPVVFNTAKSFMQIVGPCLALHGVGWSLYFASQGAGAMRAPVMALVTRPTVAILSTIALIKYADLGLYGVYIGSVAGMAAYSLILVYALKAGAWRRRVMAP